ncbi:armadillo-like helical domain-containing protein 2 [Pituophis catenifer annectens]|uniref:armadillo-like helical domain-containing protein 2 n=1 Tax=Pituophis catenifer annectens TaxID=94852 RepID=UPI003995B734
MGIVFSALKACYHMYRDKVREPVIKLIDPIFHHHKIKIYAMDLRNTELPLEERAKAALYIGLLAYTGGVGAGSFASQYIQDMIDILIMPDTSTKVRILVLKGLCSACYINPVNQNEAKAHHLSEIILSYLEEEEDSAEADPDLVLVKFWVCYLMTVVCCNNMSYIKLFHEIGGQTLEKRLEYLSNMEWFGWPQNYATLMYMFMGYPGTDVYK